MIAYPAEPWQFITARSAGVYCQSWDVIALEEPREPAIDGTKRAAPCLTAAIGY